LVHQTQSDAESDAALLARFATLRDEAAFAELMRRYGPMVLGVSSRMLRQPQDAEDVLQAVFLTLSARARALRRVQSVAGWLHNVAVRISLNSLKMKRRREDGLRRLHQDRSELHEGESQDLKEFLDEELAQLPARFKEVVILRDLEGYSRSEVAKKLRLPTGTIDSRLSRGRKLLRDRLVRRGVTVGVGGLAATLASCAGSVQALPIALAQQAVRDAALFAAGTSAGGLAAGETIISLAQGELNRMFLTKISTTVGIAAFAAALVLGALPASEIVGITSQIRAAQFFLDDFEDGSIFDGTPVHWRQEGPPFDQGILLVQNGNLMITPPNTLPFDFVDVNVRVDGLVYTDVSLRTRLRVLGTGTFSTGLNARNTYDLQNGLIGSWTTAQIRDDGRLIIGAALNDQITELAVVPSDLNPTLYDVNLKFDLMGRTARLTAWREGMPMPGSPQVTATLPNYVADQGAVGIFNAQSLEQDPKFPVAFRYFQAVPEPSSVALGSLSGIVLASLAFRTRLVHVG
jgi:RNA polymerase sigma factor (sigma-70 family)